MKAAEHHKLKDIELQDVEDTLGYLVKTFELNLEPNAFLKAKTFGDICQVFQNNIPYHNEESCTTQQAFYKIRNAIILSQKIDKDKIRPNTQINQIFPKSGRRKKIKDFQHALALPIDILSMKFWLALFIVGGFAISFIAFFFNWKLAIIGISTFIIFNWVAIKLRREVMSISVGELAMKITRDHYMQVRRNPNTVNRNEIVKVIQCSFIYNLDLNLTDLHKDALLGTI
jgi:hypothetical protein